MQKPQQRKYHSSCNRSVHRGTAHGKQRVKICKRKTPHLLMRSFLSPCGDKLKSGTRTLMAWQRSFRPLTGMVQAKEMKNLARSSFRPLTGMVRGRAVHAFPTMSFRPLTGMVLTLSKVASSRPGFRPLTGVVH